MRIISGRLKGRTFETPPGRRTHPMGDRVKGALFNTLGDIEGLSVLDAYAGSGALALEAASRGASSVLAIDVDGEAFKTISANVQKLGVRDTVAVLCKNVGIWAKGQAMQFDLIFADPPYDDIRPDVLARLSTLVKPGGLIIISWPPKEPSPRMPGMTELRSKKYAGAKLIFFRRNT